MAKAVFIVYPNPKSQLWNHSFAIEVEAYPGGLNTGEGLHFKDAELLKKFLHQIQVDPSIEGVWIDHIDRREGFAIKSSFAEWRRLQAWAEENL
jgi:hypothetical protein